MQVNVQGDSFHAQRCSLLASASSQFDSSFDGTKKMSFNRVSFVFLHVAAATTGLLLVGVVVARRVGTLGPPNLGTPPLAPAPPSAGPEPGAGPGRFPEQQQRTAATRT